MLADKKNVPQRSTIFSSVFKCLVSGKHKEWEGGQLTGLETFKTEIQLWKKLREWKIISMNLFSNCCCMSSCIQWENHNNLCRSWCSAAPPLRAITRTVVQLRGFANRRWCEVVWSLLGCVPKVSMPLHEQGMCLTQQWIPVDAEVVSVLSLSSCTSLWAVGYKQSLCQWMRALVHVMWRIVC